MKDPRKKKENASAGPALIEKKSDISGADSFESLLHWVGAVNPTADLDMSIIMSHVRIFFLTEKVQDW